MNKRKGIEAIQALIPMTDFVLQYHTYELGSVVMDIYRYAEFLSQPLQEWMFVGENALFIEKAFHEEEVIKYHITRKRDVEYLANFGSLELTPKAIEQIYGSI